MDLKGRLSNPPQRRLSPADIDELIVAYRAGAAINELAARYGIHRTTVAAHLDRHQIPRHHEQTAWDDDIVKEAAEQYAGGRSLATVADRFGVDAQTVANRFRWVGWPPSRNTGGIRFAYANPARRDTTMSDDQFIDDYGFKGPLPVTSTQRMVPTGDFPPGLAIGEIAPDFELPNHRGESFSFHADRDGSRAAVLFFRSAVW